MIKKTNKKLARKQWPLIDPVIKIVVYQEREGWERERLQGMEISVFMVVHKRRNGIYLFLEGIDNILSIANLYLLCV